MLMCMNRHKEILVEHTGQNNKGVIVMISSSLIFKWILRYAEQHLTPSVLLYNNWVSLQQMKELVEFR